MIRGHNFFALIGVIARPSQTDTFDNGGQILKLWLETYEYRLNPQTGSREKRVDLHEISAYGRVVDELGALPEEGQVWMVEGALRSTVGRNDRVYARIQAQKLCRMGIIETDAITADSLFSEPGLSEDQMGDDWTPF